jgi:5-formyltetrahydrofolate cyclo-ligase
MQIKSLLRKELIGKRRNMPDKSKKDTAIFEKLIALPQFVEAQLVLTYFSTSIEVDTRRLIGYCFDNRIAVAIPVIVDEQMRFYYLNPDFSLDVESELSIVNRQLAVVPGLAYDKSNRRLGYGGGYYDRFLRDFHGLKIGLCYREFIIEIPVEEHDEKVDIVLWN